MLLLHQPFCSILAHSCSGRCKIAGSAEMRVTLASLSVPRHFSKMVVHQGPPQRSIPGAARPGTCRVTGAGSRVRRRPAEPGSGAGPGGPCALPALGAAAPPGRAACPQQGGAGRQGARARGSGERVWAERGGARPARGREEGRRAGLGKVPACPAPARSPAGRRGRSYLAVGSGRWLWLSLPGRVCRRSARRSRSSPRHG